MNNDDLRKKFGEMYNAESMGGDIGLKGVRLSPSQYLGSAGVEGALQAFLEIVQNSVDEAGESLQFYVDNGVPREKVEKFIVDIVVDKNDTCVISDTGRGIPVDISPKFNQPVIFMAFNEINIGGKGKGYVKDGKSAYASRTIGKHGSGAACANATADFFYVESKVMKDDKIYSIKWEEASLTEPVKELGPANGQHGTKVTFRPSRDVFRLISGVYGKVARLLNEQSIKDLLTEYAYNTENILFRVKYQRINDEWVEYELDADKLIAKERLRNTVSSKIYEGTIYSDEEDFELKFYTGLRSITRNYITCNKVTLQKGTHYDAIMNALDTYKNESVALANKYLKDNKLKHDELTYADYAKYVKTDPSDFLNFYLVLSMASPDYSGQSKKELDSPQIKEIIEEEFVKLLDGDLKELKDLLLSEIAKQFIQGIEGEEARIRQQERRRLEKERKELEKSMLKDKEKNGVVGLGEEDKEYTPARSQDKGKVTLFIVEGTSGASLLSEMRNTETEAILRLEQRPPNVLLHKIEKLYKSKKFNKIFRAFKYDGEKEYKRIVLSTDGDAHGSLIRLYMLALIIKVFPSYIKKGKVFILRVPKAMAKNDKKTVIFYSDEERRNFQEKTTEHYNYITFKGLQSVGEENIKAVLANPNSFMKIDENSLREDYPELAMILTNTKYKQNFVLKHYSDFNLMSFKAHKKRIYDDHKLSFDVTKLDEQFTTEPNFDNIKTQTVVESYLTDAHFKSGTRSLDELEVNPSLVESNAELERLREIEKSAMDLLDSYDYDSDTEDGFSADLDSYDITDGLLIDSDIDIEDDGVNLAELKEENRLIQSDLADLSDEGDKEEDEDKNGNKEE